MVAKGTPRHTEASVPASSYREDHQKDVLNRLRRVEGQVRGIDRDDPERTVM